MLDAHKIEEQKVEKRLKTKEKENDPN